MINAIESAWKTYKEAPTKFCVIPVTGTIQFFELSLLFLFLLFVTSVIHCNIIVRSLQFSYQSILLHDTY